MVDFSSFFALSPFRAFAQKMSVRLAFGALLLALAFAGWGAWRLSLRSRSADMAAVIAAMEPAERALWDAALKAPQDIEARRALGQYLLARRRPYEAMWAYQDALELVPDDAEARQGLARALIIAQLPRRGLEVLAAGRGDGATGRAGDGGASDIGSPTAASRRPPVA